jgi:hypothetical protein
MSRCRVDVAESDRFAAYVIPAQRRPVVVAQVALDAWIRSGIDVTVPSSMIGQPAQGFDTLEAGYRYAIPPMVFIHRRPVAASTVIVTQRRYS